MTNLTEVENYDEGVYQFELTDPIRGGADGVDNKPTKNLANRTKWLKAQIQIILDWLSTHITNTDPHTQYLKEVDEPTQAEAEAGTMTTVRAWSALRVKQAITAIAGSLISNHDGETDPHTQYATKAGIQNVAYSSATAGGTANALTVVLVPAAGAYIDKMRIQVTAAFVNSNTTPTVAVNALAAITICKGLNMALAIGDIEGAGHVLDLVYSSAYGKMILRNPSVRGGIASVQIFNTVGTFTYTETPGTKFVIAETQGSGASGGGTPATTTTAQMSAASGGGAGAFGSSKITTGFSGVTITVGAGGVGVAGADGNNGASSSFGALVSATGGTGGKLGILTTVPNVGTSAIGVGGVATGANIKNVSGGYGKPGICLTNSATSGSGGDSQNGIGGYSPSASGSAQAGKPGVGNGSGGSGAVVAGIISAALAGGNGTNGSVFVWEYN